MYKKNKPARTTISINKSYEGETMEQKIRRVINNKEPIDDIAERIYTERKDGVQPEYDIRTDRWEIAIDAMDAITASHQAKREERHKPKTIGEEAQEGMNKEQKTTPPEQPNIGGPEPTQGTK